MLLLGTTGAVKPCTRANIVVFDVGEIFGVNNTLFPGNHTKPTLNLRDLDITTLDNSTLHNCAVELSRLGVDVRAVQTLDLSQRNPTMHSCHRSPENNCNQQWTRVARIAPGGPRPPRGMYL